LTPADRLLKIMVAGSGAPAYSRTERRTTMEDLVTIATHYSIAEAEPERVALEAAGIRTFAADENVGTMLALNVFGGIKLQVAAEDAARAEEVLAELRAEAHPAESDAGQEDDGVSFPCPECNAEICTPPSGEGTRKPVRNAALTSTCRKGCNRWCIVQASVALVCGQEIIASYVRLGENRPQR
jgi:hypothetical protein